MSPSSSSLITKLASKELLVFTAESSGFYNTITSRAFNGRLPDAAAFPHAVLQAKSVSAVQTVVNYCQANKLQICVRSGGHSWESAWLQGPNTVLLDVGDLNHITVNPDARSVSVGPGAESNQVLNAVLDHNLFFPSGHCEGVPVGGFLLGGGWGIGYSKYGLSCNLIQEMQVITADGSLVKAKADSDDPKETTFMKLAMGSYAAFPGVITQYTLGPLPAKPTIYRGSILYPLENWQKALELGHTICQNESIETTIILMYAEDPPIAASSGVSNKMVAKVALDIYDDNGMELWQQFTSNIPPDDLLEPLDPPYTCNPQEIPDSSYYPHQARFQSQVYLGDENIWNDKDNLHAALEPLINMWLSSSSSDNNTPPPPPPPSHTLLVCVPPNILPKGGGDDNNKNSLAYGFQPSLSVMTYGIYTDSNQDDTIRNQLTTAHSKLASHEYFYTSLVEGNTRQNGVKSGFTTKAYQQVQDSIHLSDPDGVFAGFPNLG